MASADYAVLPGVTLAVDLGYGDSNLTGHTRIKTSNAEVEGETVVTKAVALNDDGTVNNVKTDSAGFTGLLRVKASF